MNVDSRIIQGIATIVWGGSWADHAEEHGCSNLSGCKIEACMPAIPECAYRAAERIAGMVEQANGRSLPVLLYDAAEADGMPREDPGDAYAERFGNCLAYMATGAGVSWKDDHADFGMVVPSFHHAHEIREHADDACAEETDRTPCGACGVYLRPDRTTCPECGTAVPAAASDPRGASGAIA